MIISAPKDYSEVVTKRPTPEQSKYPVLDLELRRRDGGRSANPSERPIWGHFGPKRAPLPSLHRRIAQLETPPVNAKRQERMHAGLSKSTTAALCGCHPGSVTAASTNGRILDVSSEAKRIAKKTWLSPIITARDLFEAEVTARISMEFTRIP